MNKTIFGIIILAVGFALLLGGCGKKAEPKRQTQVTNLSDDVVDDIGLDIQDIDQDLDDLTAIDAVANDDDLALVEDTLNELK